MTLPPTPPSSSPRPSQNPGADLPSGPIAIIGAGYLGAAIAAASSWATIAVSRSGTWHGKTTPAHVQTAGIDITDPDASLEPLRGCEQVVFCVAPGRTQDRRMLYIDGPRRTLERWPGPLPRRVVWVGSTSALADRDGWIDERWTTMPATERGRVQREAERVVTTWAQANARAWWVLRLGGLYGPGRELSRIYRARSDAPRPGNGMAPTNLIHRDDATAAVLAALALPYSRGGLVHVVDDDKTPRRTMYEQIAAAHNEVPVQWAEPVEPGARAVGKRVANGRLKSWLGVRLSAPTHRLA